jgi:hypothetical protein
MILLPTILHVVPDTQTLVVMFTGAVWLLMYLLPVPE